jgi:hypothetical protein
MVVLRINHDIPELGKNPSKYEQEFESVAIGMVAYRLG